MGFQLKVIQTVVWVDAKKTRVQMVQVIEPKVRVTVGFHEFRELTFRIKLGSFLPRLWTNISPSRCSMRELGLLRSAQSTPVPYLSGVDNVQTTLDVSSTETTVAPDGLTGLN